jgi:2-dehydro-3-deoxyphosphogluconate aldolase / (4S)-4-hydroxy-2-oxoglutarate aldolase
MTTSLDDLLTGPVMAILRGLSPAETVATAQRAWGLGITTVEVPIGAPDQVASLEAAVRAGAERGLAVGAGTVVDPAQVGVAARIGARYTVAPGYDPAVLAASTAAGLPHLAGAATPTEVQRLHRDGVTWIKAFPASVLGPAWFREIRGPFPDLTYVAVGGVNAASAASFLSAGARMVAVGSALYDPGQLEQLAALLTDHR